jgi:hypothetical protein
MRLVVEAASDAEQIGKAALAYQVVAVVPEPAQQGGVDLGDGAVEQRGQVPTRRMVVEVVGVVLQHCGE